MLPLCLHDTEVMLCDCCTSVTLHVTATNLSAKGLLVVKLTLKGNTAVSQARLLGVLIVTYGHSVQDVCPAHVTDVRRSHTKRAQAVG